MNGAEALLGTAAAAGIEVCFANPGTTEMPFVAGLDRVEQIRPVLCLFEGVCTGAADGYGRMADKPALTLLHLGPGFANGIANLHNARRARSPIVNIIGDHASWHLSADAPLTSDIVSLAAPVSGWLRSNQSSAHLATDTAEAIAAALAYPGCVATLIVPHDCQIGESAGPAERAAAAAPAAVGGETIARARALLRDHKPAVLFIGGAVLRDRGLRAAGRIAAATGCRIVCETFPARLDRAPWLPRIERFPYFPEQGIEMLGDSRALLLAGAKQPVSFFGYPGLPSVLVPAGCKVEQLASPDEDAVSALEALASDLVAPDPSAMPDSSPVAPPTGPLSPATLAAAVASSQPEGAIIIDEGNTSSGPYFALSQGAPPHSYLALPGGAIGFGMPCSTGAALACPDRRVINIQADGSGMYTLQALWTQAREGLKVTTVICSNRSYRILGIEMARAGVSPGERSRQLIDLEPPVIDWVQLARSLGVSAARVESAEGLMKELQRSFSEPGPRLIETVL
jgi:acetolactate synthase-1/2/3 large subunit